jgi:hypothetical protein
MDKIGNKKKGENIEIVQKYDPDKLDYYRVDLRDVVNSTLFEVHCLKNNIFLLSMFTTKKR